MADCVALSCQAEMKLKRATTLEFTTESAIIFIHPKFAISYIYKIIRRTKERNKAHLYTRTKPVNNAGSLSIYSQNLFNISPIGGIYIVFELYQSNAFI